MKMTVRPYEGDEPFIFFSYCHEDGPQVYPLIDALTRMGYRIWFDSGITIGDEWPEVIADKLEKCTAFLPAITRAYCRSHNCKNELTFQVEDKKPIYPLKIENFPLIGGIRLQLASTQYVQLYDLPAAQWPEKVAALEPLESCKGKPIELPEPLAQTDSAEEERKQLDVLPIVDLTGYPAEETQASPVEEETGANGTQELTVDGTTDEWKKPFAVVCLPEGTILTSEGGRLFLPDSGLLLEKMPESDEISIQNQGDGKAILPGSELASNERTVLHDSLVITAGDCRYAVLLDRDAAWAQEQNKLFMLEAEATGEIRLILEEGLALGRNHPWAMGSMRDVRISHNHGRIRVQSGQGIVTDSSKNGIYINSLQISDRDGSKEQTLRSGDVLRLGWELFQYREVALKDAQSALQKDYNLACKELDSADTPEAYLDAAKKFEALNAFADSAALRALCLQKAQELEKEQHLAQAKKLSEQPGLEGLEQAIPILQSLGQWRNAAQLLEECTQKLETLRTLELQYQEACKKLEAANTPQLLAEAERMFTSLGSYRDSGSCQLRCREKAELIRRSEEERKNAVYRQALQAMKDGRAEEASALFAAIPDWRDSNQLRRSCMEQEDDFGDRTVIGDERAIRRNQLMLVDLSTGEAFIRQVQSAVIGRKINQCDMPFPANGRMSRRHAEVFAHEGKHFVKDCHSSNGTVVNGVRLEQDQTVPVGDTAILTLAGDNILAAFDSAAALISNLGYAALLKRQSDGVLLPISETPLQFNYIDPERTILVNRAFSSRCAEIFAGRGGAVLRVLQPQCVRINGEMQDSGIEQRLAAGADLYIGDEAYQYLQVPLVLFNGRSNAE